ncbi:hypothetical protein [Phocaeicola plebeius]|uniref:hypothetical protein n=1 Tax=Phocaeicola plebeius TaxID=310297 RepID=UPI0026F00FB9|nr:hypothetical protein [Phocaeicola plebeius]
MKNFFYLFFVVLFATMSFAFTSCSDDDDEPTPDKGSGVSELTINGNKYSFEYWNSKIFERYDKRIAFECDLREEDGQHLTFTIYDWENASTGTVFTDGNDIAVWWDGAEFDDCGDMNYTIVSGSIKIANLNKEAKKITISFNNVKYSCERHNASFTINGTITVEYE